VLAFRLLKDALSLSAACRGSIVVTTSLKPFFISANKIKSYNWCIQHKIKSPQQQFFFFCYFFYELIISPVFLMLFSVFKYFLASLSARSLNNALTFCPFLAETKKCLSFFFLHSSSTSGTFTILLLSKSDLLPTNVKIISS